MRICHLVAGLAALLCCTGTLAAQLGQLSTHSQLGEPLVARIELYGLKSQEFPAVGLELRPEIGLPKDSVERRLIASITPTMARDERGFPYVKLSSMEPVSEPIVSFRMRLRTATGTAVRHYTLALDPPSYRQAPVSPDEIEPADTPIIETPTQSYGPVRSGQTLWRIMQENALTDGDTSAIIERIVDDNPHAFVAGDANRLRVGVVLSLPGAPLEAAEPTQASGSDLAVEDLGLRAQAPQTQTVSPVETAPAANRFARDTATAARLAALEEKFAAIRARHVQQQKALTAAPPEISTIAKSERVELAPLETEFAAAQSPPAPTDIATPAPEIIPADGASTAATSAAPSGAGSWVYLIATILIGALVLALVVKGALMMIAHINLRRSHRSAETTDASLRAEIARKAEKRVQLEGDVKRRIEEKRQQQAPVSDNTIERAVESTGDAAAIDEAETQIAHGHYAEAETLLLNVIAKTPNNYRAKLRLAEIYYLNERRDDFVRIAEVIYNRHRADIGDDNWQRIMRMGKIIAPERPPFSGPAAIESEA